MWKDLKSLYTSDGVCRSRHHPPSTFPRDQMLIWLCAVCNHSVHQAAVMGDTVQEPWRCLSLLLGCYFHHTSVNIVSCHAQVVWENDQVQKHWERIHHEIGLVNLLVSLQWKLQLQTYRPSSLVCCLISSYIDWGLYVNVAAMCLWSVYMYVHMDRSDHRWKKMWITCCAACWY